MAKVVSLSKAEVSRRRAVVDELGKLEAELAKVDQARARALKAEIRSWADAEYPSHQPVSFEGDRYSAQVSAKGKVRRFRSMEILFDLLGKVKFLAHCAFTLKEAEEHLAPADFERAVVEEANAGDRTVKAVLRAGCQAKAA